MGEGARVTHKIVRRLFQEMRVKIGHQKSRQKEIVQLSDTRRSNAIKLCKEKETEESGLISE